MIDTHCHIHSKFFKNDPDTAITQAAEAGVNTLICVGTDADDSATAVSFVAERANCYASVGIHPHEAEDSQARRQQLEGLAGAPKVVAIGEIGLDYWYLNAPKAAQKQLLIRQIELAQSHDLPIIFHIRGSKSDAHDAFVDFFEIFDTFSGIRGVVHSFTAGQKSLTGVLSRSLLVGVNGIATFSKDIDMQAAYRAIPSRNLVLETDAPFLTPVPKRGIVNTPKYMGYTANYMAELRGESLDELRRSTTDNAKRLFGIE